MPLCDLSKQNIYKPTSGTVNLGCDLFTTRTWTTLPKLEWRSIRYTCSVMPVFRTHQVPVSVQWYGVFHTPERRGVPPYYGPQSSRRHGLAVMICARACSAGDLRMLDDPSNKLRPNQMATGSPLRCGAGASDGDYSLTSGTFENGLSGYWPSPYLCLSVFSTNKIARKS